jgi:hypothetical protein
MNSITQESLELMKGALAAPDSRLAKSISTATGLLAYDLQAPAKNLYPFVTPLRNIIPRVGGGVGSATNWRQVNAIIGSGFDSMGWVPEGQRSGQMSYSTSNKTSPFVTIGEEDAATFEAISAGRQFEDIQAQMAFRLLQKMMLKDENGNPGGQRVIVSRDTRHSHLVGIGFRRNPARCDLFCEEGYQNSSILGGVATSKTVTGADGKSFALSGGSSAISAEASQAVILGQTLFCSVSPLQGAVAYAWYVSTTSGSETLQAITTINSLAISTPLGTGTQSQSAVTADNSANSSYAYDGLLTTALKPGSNAYVNIMPTGTAGAGTPLTASGRGSIVEIDTMFQKMWDNFQVSPTALYVNSQELKNITAKVLSSASGPLLRYDSPADGSAGEYQLTASGVVQFYYNPFALNGGLRIPIRIHPKVPPGTVIGWAENLPIQYQSNEVPNVAEIKTRQDYYQIDWPIVTRQRQLGVYAEEVLAVYAPFAMGVICNIANG